MADYLAEAIKAAQQQAIASNPYANFGAMFGSAKMPANEGDPWGNLAGIAAQQAIAGLASGFGQADVNNQMQMIAPQISQLYANPSKAVNSGVDDSVWGPLLNAAYQNEAARKAEQAQFMGQEQFKVGIQPDTLAKSIASQRAQEDYLAEIESRIRRKAAMGAAAPALAPVSPITSPAAAVVPVAPSAAPATSPVTAAAPTGQPVNLSPGAFVPQVSPEFLRGIQILPQARQDAAIEEELKRLGNERAKEVSSFQTKSEQAAQAENDQKAKNIEGLNKMLTESNQNLKTTEGGITKLKVASKDLPDFGGLTGPVQKFYTEKIASRNLGGKFKEDADKAMAAQKTIDAVKLSIVGPMRKEVFPGSTSNFEIDLLMKPIPDNLSTKAEVNAAVQALTDAFDLQRLEAAYIAEKAKMGLTPAQIHQDYARTRAALGGSFIDQSTGRVNPLVYEKLFPRLGLTR